MVARPVFTHVLEGRPILRHILAPDASPGRRIAIAALAAFSGLAAYAVFSEAEQGSALDARVHSLKADNAALRQQISQREQEIGEADNVDWLEEQARRLGFVFPGESIFIITTPGAGVPSSGGVNATLPTFAPPPPRSPAPTSGGSPSPQSSPTARPSPTPVVFVMPSPSPH